MKSVEKTVKTRRITRITTTQNATFQLARRLKRRRERDETQLFRIEGRREIDRALDANLSIEKVIFCDTLSRFNPLSSATLTRLQDRSKAEVFSTSASLFNAVSQWQNPDGLLIIAQKPNVALERLTIRSDRVYLVVEGIEKPGNIGNMFRSADATTCDGLLISNPVVDLWNPNVIRASLGTVFTMPCAVGRSEQILDQLRSAKLRIISTSPDATTHYLHASLGRNCALVIGSEKSGLSDAWISASDEVVKLPSEGYADSLNAAMTATVMLFESHRQRHAKSRLD